MLAEEGDLKPEDERPDIQFDEWLLEGFFELSTTRQLGMAVGPIPIDKVYWYADRFGLSQYFVDVILSLDAEYVELVNQENASGDGDNGDGQDQDKASGQ